MPRPHPLLLDLAAERVPRPHDRGQLVGILSSSIEHRMSGLLRSSAADRTVNLPAEERRLLEARDLAQRAHHERLWNALVAIQRRLERRGILTAAAKGVAAEARWYARTGERPCRDLDLLLEPGSVSRVDEVIDELQPDHPFRSEVVRLVRTGTLQSVDLNFEGIGIDLHADLLKVEVPTRGREGIWERTLSIATPAGTLVRVLDAEISLILFAIHLNKDRFARLLGYADIVRLLAREPIDWSFVDDFLWREGLRIPVYSSLHAVSSDLGTAPPDVPRPGGWRATAWRALWPPRSRLRGALGSTTGFHRQLWIPWIAEGRTREALRWWMLRRVVPSADLLRLYEPDVDGRYPWRWLVVRYRGWRRRRDAHRRVSGTRDRYWAP